MAFYHIRAPSRPQWGDRKPAGFATCISCSRHSHVNIHHENNPPNCKNDQKTMRLNSRMIPRPTEAGRGKHPVQSGLQADSGWFSAQLTCVTSRLRLNANNNVSNTVPSKLSGMRGGAKPKSGFQTFQMEAKLHICTACWNKSEQVWLLPLGLHSSNQVRQGRPTTATTYLPTYRWCT